ncbi:MAG: hypothetical protein ABII89_07510 [Candidatus Omnitrophota bacterium]
MRYTEQMTLLAKACAWFGIDRGRGARYGKLIREFFEDDLRSPQHILAYGESCEIVDLFVLWKASVTKFPGIAERMRVVLGKGPLLREEENPATSSNRPRNDAFNYLVAGWLLAAGVPVVTVDGINAHDANCSSEADVTFRWNGTFLDIECKRPRSHAALGERTAEARAQIEHPSRQGRYGIIAVDCSVLVRPAGTLLENDSGAAAEGFVSSALEMSIAPRIKSLLTNSILGFLLFARVPAMIRVRRSAILTTSGKPIRHFRPDSILTWLVISNAQYASSDVLRDVANRLLNVAHGLKGDQEEPPAPANKETDSDLRS